MILRIFSTVILSSIVIGGVAGFGEVGTMWILTVAAVCTQFEIYALLGRLGFAANRISGLATGAFLVPMGYYIEGAGMDTLAVGALMMSGAAVLFPQAQRGMYVKRLLPTFFGLVFVPFLLHYFVRILQTSGEIPSGTTMSFGLFFCLWLLAVAKFSDIGALLVGKMIGRTKMAPSISPGKTIEGLVGGIAASAGIGAFLPWVLQNHRPELVSFEGVNFDPGSAAILALPIAVAAVIGDLIASVLKRLANIKDSGGAIPGIGGMLDLTDSLILAAPTGYFLLLALLR
ncbi:MAG: phosphatidate cytidylyltransferase [Verrucomicrobia bacterium]|nr:phosphatidate cytidylyltransferase [Verrucomicrobiota bacterium]MDA0725205.1 phosphatidate cytidylyltransferase [Verrucomicrobiota bacterium]MDA1048288.1 phosphatidate cytidylyltransferase [Verrucomicrobiota bacterium]